MTAYWLGLATLPALTGAVVGLYGLYLLWGRVIDKAVVSWLPPARTPYQAAAFAGIVAGATRTAMILRVSPLINVHISIGTVDQERAALVREAVLAALPSGPRTISVRRRSPGGE